MTESGSTWPAEAINALVDRYERPLLAYAGRMLGGDWQGAQDAVQETFLRLCREDPAKIESRVAAWLFSVCRTRVIDMQDKSLDTFRLFPNRRGRQFARRIRSCHRRGGS